MINKIGNPYGFFDIQRKEYVISRPDTPTPWINYLGQGKYGGIISNTAGGYSFDRDPKNRRVTRYRYNSIPADQPGRYIYLKDLETGIYWSPSWQPIPTTPLENYECRHGSGYTRIKSTYKGIRASILYFIPKKSDLELWVFHLKNNSSKPRNIRTFSYVEFSYYDALTDLNNLDWGAHIFHSSYQNETIITGTQFSTTKTFFSSNNKPIGYDTDRDVFVGRGRDLSRPIIVEEGKTRQTEAPRGNNIGCLSHDFNLSPGEEVDLVYILGLTDDIQAIPRIIDEYRTLDNISQAFENLCSDWESYLDRIQVYTPDNEMNAMLNFWNPVQCRTTLFWSRFVSAYETGLGRGLGTRDSAQDILAVVNSEPELTRSTLTRLWQLQFSDGHTWHQVYPLTNEGGPGLAAEFPDWPQWFSDDHLWLVLAACAYLKETGDYSYLSEKINYWDDIGNLENVWEHMMRAIQFTLSHRGPKGLPRIGFSDWNDTLNIDHGSGKAESVWTGQLFCRVTSDLGELCEYLGKMEQKRFFSNLHQEMADIIQAQSWDGKWFARAFDDNGDVIGTQNAPNQQISLNPQTWSVLGEIGRRDRQLEAMRNAEEILSTSFGLMLMSPPYSKYDLRIQGTTTYPPGAKENAGIFCHANAWAIISAAKLGQTDKAFEFYKKLIPLARLDADTYAAEPYVYCSNICGPDHPQFGLGRNSWLSGTASWMYIAATQYILGIQPTYVGLRITPAVPDYWQTYTVKRWWRKKLFSIIVNREGPGTRVKIKVNGEEIDGDTVPYETDYPEIVNVHVSLGIIV